jgi:predicted nucleotidyltransferase
VGQWLNCYPEGVTTTVVPRDRILSVLQAGPPLRLAMLFGSAARGTAHAGSDLDIGIVPVDPELALSIELDLQAELARVCGRDVDLVRLDRAPTLVKWKVARDGQVLLQWSPSEAARFVASAASEYLDFAPSFERAAERFRRSLVRAGKQVSA